MHPTEALLFRLDPMMESYADRPCERPWGWWEFEAREAEPRFEDEADRLEALGVLTPIEKGLLEAKRHDAAEAAAARQRWAEEYDAERRARAQIVTVPHG